MLKTRSCCKMIPDNGAIYSNICLTNSHKAFRGVKSLRSCTTRLIKPKVLKALQQELSMCRLELSVGVRMIPRLQTEMLSKKIKLLLMKYEYLDKFFGMSKYHREKH